MVKKGRKVTMSTIILCSTSNILFVMGLTAHMVANAVVLVNYILERAMDKELSKSDIHSYPQGWELAGEILKMVIYGWINAVGLTKWMYTYTVTMAILMGLHEEKRKGPRRGEGFCNGAALATPHTRQKVS